MATVKGVMPFLWGANGEQLSPEQVKSRRASAEGLRAPAGYTPKGWASLLGALAGEGVAEFKTGQADEAEKAGHSKVAEALAKARETGDYMGVMSDEWATPQQTSVAGALQGRSWDKQDTAEDRAYRAAQAESQWARGAEERALDAEYRRAQIEALKAKPAGPIPASYQEYLLSQQDPEYAKTLASSSTKPPTEGERRNNQLATVIGPELESVEQNWSALTDAGNQIKGADVGGAKPGLALTTPEYQQAMNSLSTIVASYLYSVSGATATDAEIKRQVDLLTPKFGESEASAKDKLDRIKTYASAVTEAAGRAGSTPPSGGTDDIDAILKDLGI